MKVNIGNDLYLKGRIGWKGLSKDEYLERSDFRIINGYSLKDGYIDWNIAGYISKERYEESPEIKLKLNDILISKDGTIGKVGIVRNLLSPTTVASGIFVLRNIIDDKLDTEYLFQYLKSPNFKTFINAVKASGSTIIHLYQRDLAKLEIEVPNLGVQKSIAKILFSIDSKIELNNRINAELEAMAKTVYDYWFVQFDFPDKNGKPYKTSGGKMVWNEELKREIPEGWESGELNKIGDIIGGSTPSKAIKENFCIGNGIPWITPKDLSIHKGKKYITRGELNVTESGLKSASLKIMPAGTVLLSSRAPIGYLAISRSNVTTNQGFKSFVPNSRFSTEFIFYTIKNLIPEIEANSSGSTFQEVSTSTLGSIKTVLPTNDILNIFDKKLNPFLNNKIS